MQQVQSENEKMVPIDTSGESVEVELKDEKEKEQNTKQESNEIVVEQESETKKVESDELDQYSESVKKRIDKLTKKMREAERREQAAIDYAKKVKEENDKITSTNLVQNDTMLVEREGSLKTQKEFAKRA